MKSLIFTVIYFFGVASGVHAQLNVDSLIGAGQKFYKKNQYDTAARLWEQGAMAVTNRLSKNTYYSYSASAYASAMDSVNSFRCLELAVFSYGFNDLPALKNDDAYQFMLSSERWSKIVKSIKPTYSSNPKRIKIIDTDVLNFWKAYDLVEKEKENAKEIYMKNYINNGTMALQYYYVNKIDNIENFVNRHNLKKEYYKSIRASTLKAAELKSTYRKSFIHLKNIYPASIFPPVYFVIGKLNSGGTASSEGLILAIDQACMSAMADTTELSDWEKANISSFKNLPHTVAHELIHFQQDGMASDTTLLAAAIKEGMADFIGELISGQSANPALLAYGNGKEKEVWAHFEKEMYLDVGFKWISNGAQKDKPSDLGYWVGYQICKAYYEETKDKKAAIREMLNIKDYRKFLEVSKMQIKFKQDAK